MLSNKSANILAFDEIIGKNTSFEGNTPSRAIEELKEIIIFLNDNKCYTEIIKKEHLIELQNIISQTKVRIDIKSTDMCNNNYYLVGWVGHAILLFFEKIDDNTNNVGIINAGEGVSIQGTNGDSGNCIIIFKNIQNDTLYNFLKDYETFYNNINSLLYYRDEKSQKYDYYSFYSLLFNRLVDKDNNNVNFSRVINNENIETLKINTQHIGSCSFTNQIYYLCYLIYKKIPGCDYNDIYLEWYNKAKNIMKIKLYNEIIQNYEEKGKYYFTYKYILDTCNDVSIDPNYEEHINNVEFEYNFFSDIKSELNTDILSRDTIYKGSYASIFWDLYMNNSEQFMNKISEFNLNNSNEDIESLLNDLFKFYLDCKRIDNNLNYIIPLLEVYNLKKKNILINDSILLKLFDNYLRKEENKIYKIIYVLIISILLSDSKTPYYNINDINENDLYLNKKIYMLFLSYIPIINGKYFELINDLIQNIIENIYLFPNFKMISDDTSLDNNIHKEYAGLIKQKRSLYEIKFRIKSIDNNFNKLWTFTREYGIDMSINYRLDTPYFLIDNLFLENSYTSIQNTVIDNFMYETYGYCLSQVVDDYDDYNNEIFKISENKISTNIFNNKIGIYNPFKNKINLFKQKIFDKLINFDLSNLKNYIIYFYLCELNGQELENEIFTQYDHHIDEYFIKNIKDIKNIIYTYILKYNKTIQLKYEIFTIKHDTLIPQNEKEYFIINNPYKYILKDGYCKSIINFFIIDYNSQNKIVLYKKNEKTIVSVEIIKKLFENNYNIYLGLNFDFEYDSNKTKIIGRDKINNSIKIIGDYNISNGKITNLYYIKNEINYQILNNINIDIDSEIDSEINSEINIYIKNFYKIITINENIFLFYKNTENTIHFIKLHNYDLEFEISDNKVYYYLDSIKYEVLFNHNSYTYNNFGVFTLFNQENSPKLLCIYNYNILNNFKTNNSEYSFVNSDIPYEECYHEKNFDSGDINQKYIKYYYTIINSFENNFILKNEEDGLVILFNCLYFNSPLLLIKTIRQIEQIIINYNIDIKLINTLFIKSKNAYSLILYDLIYKKEKLHNHNYYYFNKLLKKYDVNIETSINKELDFYYLEIEIDISTYHDSDFKYYHFLENKYIPVLEKDSSEISIFQDSSQISYMCKLDNYKKIYFEITTSYTNSNYSVDKNKLIIYNESYINTTELFKKLLQDNIKNINILNLENNLIKAQTFFSYLIDQNKTYLLPVQELIMGSGKSSVITPYLCLLLINHFISIKNYTAEIYIVMPEFLIQQSIEILMKNLFVINSNVEIILYPNNYIYSNSIKIYLISDTNYKEMFLTSEQTIINTTNKYMIYDEVDNMSDPLSCELNIPINSSKTELLNIELIFNLTKNIYNLLFRNNKFWDLINQNYNNVNDNLIHKYIISNINEKQKTIINNFYDENISNIFDQNNPLINYFKSNILEYILTKQYNYDYGIPSDYPNYININYKYKAIPYSCGDAPLYGSDFSDPILTYVLTYFCYYYNFEKKNLRKIDKLHIIRLYEKEYYENYNRYDSDEKDLFLKTFNGFFDKEIKDIDIYFDNREYFLNNIKNDISIEADKFENIIISILNKNKNYYQRCNNISFNDLLLYKNIKNFVSFTGTAYIKLPIEPNIGYLNNKYIEYGSINQFPSIEKAIESIILDNNKTTLYRVNKSDSLINDIFSCITDYDVLIDIGAIFINYTNEKFKNKYKNVSGRKKYLVYFEDSIKIYNLDNNIYETKTAINVNEKNTFFYFSNKNITGVDAKEIMNKSAKGLVTITNKTILRDFSQGIFRMRNILDGEQSIDIVINKIMINEENNIIRGGACNVKTIEINRKNLFNILKSNQDLLNDDKYQLLLKQNILALIKSSPKIGNFYLYNDPSIINDEYKQYYNNIITLNKDVKYIYESLCKFDKNNINDYNIIYLISTNCITHLEPRDFLICLIINYFNKKGPKNIQINRSTNIEIAIELEVVEEKNTQINTSININRLTYENINVLTKNCLVTANLYINHNFKQNGIIFCFDMLDYQITFKIFILYDKINNNIYVIDKNFFNYYLLYNNVENFYQNYILISLQNNISYDIESSSNQIKIKIIKIIIIKLIRDIYLNLNLNESRRNKILDFYKISLKDELFINNNQEDINTFNSTFNFFYCNSNYNLNNDRYYNKYLKYKSKYIIKKKIISDQNNIQKYY
jgi:hypothetical protein